MAATGQTFGSPLASVDDAMSGTANATSAEGGLLSAAVAGFQHAPIRYTLSTLFLTFLFYLYKMSIPEVDGKEPPLMLPRIPFIGHLIGLVRNQSQYYTNLHKKTGAPIATLPMLGGKTYAIWDPALVQSALRQKTLSFEPFAVDFLQTMLGMKEESYNRFREKPEIVVEFFDALHVTVRGEPLHRMNANALNFISSRLDAMKGDGEVRVDNFFLWLREIMTLATTTALLGKKNPLLHDRELIDHLWTWENALPKMLITPWHQVTNADAFRSREKLQKALGEYYSSRGDHDETVAAVTSARSAVLRKHGLPDSEIGRFEASLLQLATGNTIPTTFWMVANVFTRLDIVERLRAELEPLMQRRNGDEQDVVSINITRFDEACPLLVSCYRESIRLSNHALCVRRVMEETVISDGRGQSYTLKKGSDVQIPAGFTHRDEDVWGSGAAAYEADRFVGNQARLSAAAEKRKRSAYIPFGGGKHLCPGRNFAFAEILGASAALILAFDLSADGRGSPVRLPDMATTTIMGGASKPDRLGEGMSLVIKRRPGWEKVKFEFEVVGGSEQS
ncbi:cytochrome p450 [Hirsutella rhossiliensis]|uniref:Cytochrome p450 domain-containing protein n=1 Tax=Hirsutella rhossiliensis TaxID=111463 RepID=A0A9P8SJI7_9HYPO|nr:cytochrome p450 domain-containing protein [Hirsutella rhossiliensis]KAH0964249.1 cytochrome p450 domain-containing protein [Hirsutella rhossiliensis]